MVKNELTKKLFLSKIRALGYNEKKFAKFVGRTEDALKKWDDTNIPEWAWTIIDLLQENQEYRKFVESYRYINSMIQKVGLE